MLGILQYFEIFTSPTVEVIHQSGDSDHVIYPRVTHRQNRGIFLSHDIKLFDWSKSETPINPGERLVELLFYPLGFKKKRQLCFLTPRMLGHIGLVRGVFVVSTRTQFIAQKYLLAGFGVVWYIQACRIFPVFFSFVFRVLENDFELFVLRVCAIFLLVSWCRADDVFFTFHLLFGCFVVAYILFRGCVSLVVSLCPFYSFFLDFTTLCFVPGLMCLAAPPTTCAEVFFLLDTCCPLHYYI